MSAVNFGGTIAYFHLWCSGWVYDDPLEGITDIPAHSSLRSPRLSPPSIRRMQNNDSEKTSNDFSVTADNQFLDLFSPELSIGLLGKRRRITHRRWESDRSKGKLSPVLNQYKHRSYTYFATHRWPTNKDSCEWNWGIGLLRKLKYMQGQVLLTYRGL